MIAEYAAVKSRLEADPDLDERVFDAARADGDGLIRDQYVILFGGAPDELNAQRLTAASNVSSDATYTYTTRSVGVSAAACLAVAAKVTTQLAGYVVAITGRNCAPIRPGDGDGSARPDNTVRPPMFFLDQDWILVSLRA